MSSTKPKIYLTSPVFYEIATHPKVSQKWKTKIDYLFQKLNQVATIIQSQERFPPTTKILETVKTQQVDFIGCHLSHPISAEIQNAAPIKAVCTSTAGYNHINLQNDILYTHTPSVLDKTVADFTIAVILASLRDLIDLHDYVWQGKWNSDEKWDLDQYLNQTLDHLTVGIVGLGEIGTEIVHRLAPWGINLQYHDIKRKSEVEKKYPRLNYESELVELFSSSDIITLHVPLNKKTKHLVGGTLLKSLKPGALLVNTSRGAVLNFKELLQLLENNRIRVNLAFDVYDPEPISQEYLQRFQKIKKQQPNLRFLFSPHNASSDADTRAQMSCMLFEDLITLATSQNLADLQSLRLIPDQRSLLPRSSENQEKIQSYRIAKWWKSRKL